MTDETDPTQAPLPEDVPTAVDRPLPAAAPSAGPPSGSQPVPSAPYRTALETAPPFVPRASTAVTVWGPALWTFGIVLWSYVVMGQLATTYAPGRHSLLVGEGTAILFVLVASFVAWLVAVRRSLGASPAPGWAGRIARGFILGMLASMSWCTVTAGAAVAGKSAAKNADGSITVMLLVVSIAALLYGRRLSPRPTDPPPTQRARTFTRVLWTGAGLLTLVALIALGASD
ncbi:MAG TPA: hypothetical protein VF765_15085 [Polyangiaceae bacterium]